MKKIVVQYSTNSGSTQDDAIIITGVNEHLEGVQAEYQYINEKYGLRGSNWVLVSQSLIQGKSNVFDLIILKLLDRNEEIQPYFDITEFFRKDFESIKH